LLARNNIPYTSIDTTNNVHVRALMAQRFNTTAIPVTVIDNSYVIGFNKPLIRQLLCL
jgi:hypothetical protein